MSRLLIFTITIFSSLFLGFTPNLNTTNEPIAPIEAVNQNALINWLSWDEAMELMKVEKRKVLVDIYTDWCGWCKRMDKTTFSNEDIVKYVNKNYYAVKFNAEYKEPIEVGDKVYKFVKSSNKKGRGYHELALALTMGRLSYPSFVFMNEDANVIQPIPGYKDADAFEVIMTYFGGNFHQSVPWQQYQDNYVSLKEQQKVISSE